MKGLTIAAAAALLTGCASYADIQALPPYAELTTQKTPSEYVACLMPKARERWPNLATVGPDGASQVLTIAGDGYGAFASVTVEPAGEGSRVIYRTKTEASRFREFAFDVAACS